MSDSSNHSDSSCWWVGDGGSLDGFLIFSGHEGWTKSEDGGGDKVWSKVPHSDDGWSPCGLLDSTDEDVTNKEIADVSAPRWFATNCVCFSFVSISWSFIAIAVHIVLILN